MGTSVLGTPVIASSAPQLPREEVRAVQAIGFSSIFFGVMHLSGFNPLEVVFAYGAGVILAYLAYTTKSLTPAITAMRLTTFCPSCWRLISEVTNAQARPRKQELWATRIISPSRGSPLEACELQAWEDVSPASGDF